MAKISIANISSIMASGIYNDISENVFNNIKKYEEFNVNKRSFLTKKIVKTKVNRMNKNKKRRR